MESGGINSNTEKVAMSMIFPGMDPYLEVPELWPGVHNILIVNILNYLRPLLRPRYIAAIEERVFVEGPQQREFIPDVLLKQGRPPREQGGTAVLGADEALEVQIPALEMHESYLEILDRHNGQRVVAVLEVLSPANKYAGPGRDSYLAKQHEVLASQAHLIEIDLLRRGPHTLAVPEWIARQHASYDYLICVNRAEGLRDRFRLYPRQLRQRLPRIRVPLADGDPDVVLDVQAVLAQTYEAGSYHERLRYDRPCIPSLSAEDQAWADELIRASQQGQG
jgi:hypothetical protein